MSVVSDVMRANRATILRNVRAEVDAVQRETRGRLQGKTDIRVALEGVSRLAAAVEALAMILAHTEDEPDQC